MKTTSLKKYSARPNIGVIQPWDSCIVTVAQQAQKEYPPYKQCKDKFLLQVTKVPSNTDVDELPPDTFNKEDGKLIEETMLGVVYVSKNWSSLGIHKIISRTSHLISVYPEELQFHVELNKQSFCDLKVYNSTEHHVAFKMKKTSPKKYGVQPRIGVIQPWDLCIMRVNLQAQKEYPPDMQCKDKFLLQSTKVPSNTDADKLPPHTFNEEDGKLIEHMKLRVVYVSPNSGEDTANASMKHALQRLKDTAIRQTQQLGQELETLKRDKNRINKAGFSRFSWLIGNTEEKQKQD